jgi:cell pole-organizing protein PopZ
MEEILASIRKIISEDSGEPAQAQAPAAPQPRPVEDVHDLHEADVLELTQEVQEEPAPAPVVAPPPPPPAPVVAAVAPPPLPETVADDVVFQPIEETPVSIAAQAASGEGIFSDKTRKALNDAFTNLEPEEPVLKPLPSGPSAPVAPVDGRTLEAVFDHAVRSTFDPVLQNWLDQNKDAVVERMKPVITQWLEEHMAPQLEEWVRDEVASVAKKSVRR